MFANSSFIFSVFLSFVTTLNFSQNSRSHIFLRYENSQWKSCSHGGSKTKALSYLRDTPADASVPVTMDGELNLKITFIDGKRSPDRSWRTVTAEIRGTKLKMTIHREGKSNQVSTRFSFIFFVPFFKGEWLWAHFFCFWNQINVRVKFNCEVIYEITAISQNFILSDLLLKH